MIAALAVALNSMRQTSAANDGRFVRDSMRRISWMAMAQQRTDQVHPDSWTCRPTFGPLRPSIVPSLDRDIPTARPTGDRMLKDLRYGVRMLLHARGWTAVVVLSLAVGIGANTALFSAINGMLIETLPV